MTKKRGFTLVEVVVSMLVLTTTLVSVLGVYIGFTQMTVSNRNLSQAMNDARVVFEAVRDSCVTGGLAAVTGIDWTGWASDATQGNLTSAERDNPPALDGETVGVQYTASWGGADASAQDPLPVTVRVSWQEKGRGREIFMSTLVTRR